MRPFFPSPPPQITPGSRGLPQNPLNCDLRGDDHDDFGVRELAVTAAGESAQKGNSGDHWYTNVIVSFFLTYQTAHESGATVRNAKNAFGFPRSDLRIPLFRRGDDR